MIALYKGTSPTSRVIEFVNWSPFSHAAWGDETDGLVVEAWEGRVRRATGFLDNHRDATPVVFFRVPMANVQRMQVRKFMLAQVGKPYDFPGILHFATRLSEHGEAQDRWFCSELVFAAHAAAGVNLLARIDAWKVYPGMISYSPILVPAPEVTAENWMKEAA